MSSAESSIVCFSKAVLQPDICKNMWQILTACCPPCLFQQMPVAHFIHLIHLAIVLCNLYAHKKCRNFRQFIESGMHATFLLESFHVWSDS